MSSITTYLNQILRSVYGKDVRQAIHDAISQCYDDVNAPALQTEAMQAAVQAKIDAGEMAALTIADGSLTGAKLANGTISTAKIADGAITAGKIASGVIPTTDTTLTQPGVPADAKAVGDALAGGGGGSGITDQEKALILSLFRNAAYNSDVSTIYATLYDLWNDSPEPTPITGLIHRWDLTQSLTDNVGGLTASLGGTNTSPTQDSNGVTFSASGQYMDFGAVYGLDRTYELDVASLGTAFGNTQRQRIFCADDDTDHNAAVGSACVIGGIASGSSDWGWSIYRGNAWGNVLSDVGTDASEKKQYFSGRTVKVYVSSDHKWTVKSKSIGGNAWVTHLVGESVSPTNWGASGKTFHVQIGSTGSTDVCTGLTISGLRVYEGEV